MTNEEWNTRLYEKMFAEQEVYRSWILLQPPEEILNHAYAYVMREDILLSLEYGDLSDRQAKALLKSPALLADISRQKKIVTCCIFLKAPLICSPLPRSKRWRAQISRQIICSLFPECTNRKDAERSAEEECTGDLE
jgi:hypothetical protein